MMYYYYLPLLATSLCLLWPFLSGILPVTATDATYQRTGLQSSLGTKPTHSIDTTTILLTKELKPGPSSHRKLQESDPSNCPIDFSYVSQFSWASPLCENDPSRDIGRNCCLAIHRTFGIGIAKYLWETGNFELPDNATVFSCISRLHSRLAIRGGLVMACLVPLAPSFVQSPKLCGGIETTANWTATVGPSAMDTSCRGDLSETAACVKCIQDATDVLATLNGTSKCFYFVSLYGAAVVNTYGPTNPDTAKCLLAAQVEPASMNHHRVIIISASVGATAVFIIGIISAFLAWFYMRQKVQQVQRKFVVRNTVLLSTALRPNTGARWLKYEDIKRATNGFSDVNIVGVGGFATVYRGRMPDGTEVAVKKIKNCTPEGDREFRNEVEAINNIRHKHLVVLRGCCVTSNSANGHQRLLVYDYMPNGTLEDHLFSTKHSPLSWSQRRNIALGAAKGIAYLHEGVYPPIIHRDIKTCNILLDAELNAKVADLGLARITEEGITHITTRVAGTQGYLAPEYALYGQLTEKSDVYSFGVLLLVLMSGRRALDISASQCLITDWAWGLVKEGRLNEIIEARIREEERLINGMERFVLVGILCAHLLVAFRPTMSQALKMLEGDLEIPSIPDRPLPLNAASLYSKDKDYSSSPSATGISYMYSAQDMLR